MSPSSFLDILRTALKGELPGKRAQDLMAPHPRFLPEDGEDRQGPPVRSAVLVLLVPGTEGLSIPFIKRSPYGRHHGGQMAFPGGRMEGCDADAVSAALRECREEIGIPEAEVNVLGLLTEVYIPVSHFLVTPVLGVLQRMPDFVLSENEVERVSPVPVEELFAGRNRQERILMRADQAVRAPGYCIGSDFIWGATAMIVSELEQLFRSLLGGKGDYSLFLHTKNWG